MDNVKQPRNIPSLRRRYQQFALGLIALLLLISLWRDRKSVV